MTAKTKDIPDIQESIQAFQVALKNPDLSTVKQHGFAAKIKDYINNPDIVRALPAAQRDSYVLMGLNALVDTIHDLQEASQTDKQTNKLRMDLENLVFNASWNSKTRPLLSLKAQRAFTITSYDVTTELLDQEPTGHYKLVLNNHKGLYLKSDDIVALLDRKRLEDAGLLQLHAANSAILSGEQLAENMHVMELFLDNCEKSTDKKTYIKTIAGAGKEVRRTLQENIKCITVDNYNQQHQVNGQLAMDYERFKYLGKKYNIDGLAS